MSIRLTAGLVSCLMMSFVVGCMQSPGLVRGQSPTPVGPTAGPIVTPAAPVHEPPYNNFVARGLQNQVLGNVPNQEHYYPNCYKNGELPTWNGQKWVYADGSDFWGWAPQHLYSFRYEAPRDLVYPEPNPTPGAMVQYPYYTHKGPDDFFLK